MIENGLYVDKEVTRHSSMFAVAPTAGSSTQIVPASAKRVAITFISDGTQVVILGQNNPVLGTQSIRLATAAPILTLDKDKYGSLIQGPWFATTVAGTGFVAAIDTVES